MQLSEAVEADQLELTELPGEKTASGKPSESSQLGRKVALKVWVTTMYRNGALQVRNRVKSSQVITLLKAKSKTRSKQNKLGGKPAKGLFSFFYDKV